MHSMMQRGFRSAALVPSYSGRPLRCFQSAVFQPMGVFSSLRPIRSFAKRSSASSFGKRSTQAPSSSLYSRRGKPSSSTPSSRPKKSDRSGVNPFRLMDGRPSNPKPKVAENGFVNLGIQNYLLKRLGFTTPSKIQTRAIPHLLPKWEKEVSDYSRTTNAAVMHAPNGSGKTLSYLLPTYSRLEPALEKTQAIIITPTDSLAKQIVQVAGKFEIREGGWSTRDILGQTDPGVQHTFNVSPSAHGTLALKDLDRPPLVLVSNYSHLKKALQDANHDLSSIKYVIVDEADYILSRAQSTIEELLQMVAPSYPIVSFVTATASTQVLHAANQYSGKDLPALYISPERTVAVSEVVSSQLSGSDLNVLYSKLPKTVSHHTVSFSGLPDEQEQALARIQILKHLVGTLLGRSSYTTGSTILVFTNDLRLFEEYGVESILRRAWRCKVSTLHENASRSEFGKAFKLSRRLETGADVVLCSDSVARGLDLKAVSHVINMEIPPNLTSYLHRAGRVGRLGGYSASVPTVRLRGNPLHPQSGQVITIVDVNDTSLLEKFRTNLKEKVRVTPAVFNMKSVK